jgi:hypothetical protein
MSRLWVSRLGALSEDVAADTVNPDSTYPTIPANGTGPNTYYVFTAGEGLNSATYQPVWVRPTCHDMSRCASASFTSEPTTVAPTARACVFPQVQQSAM